MDIEQSAPLIEIRDESIVGENSQPDYSYDSSGSSDTYVLAKSDIFEHVDRRVSPSKTVKMADTKHFQLPQFNGQNYHDWRRQMEIFMAQNKLKPYILGELKRPDVNPDDWDEQEIEAEAFLMRGLELSQMRYLTDCKTSAQMWSRLKTIHSERSDRSAQVLLDRFVNARIDDNEKVADYIARVTSLAQRLKDMDIEQKEPVIIAKIVGSLPPWYDNVRTAWYAVPRVNQTVEKLTDYLVNEEKLLNARTSHPSPLDGFNMLAKKHQKKDQASRRPSGKCHHCGIPGYCVRMSEKAEG